MYEEVASNPLFLKPTWTGIPLPLMPSKPILRAAYQYEKGRHITLCSNPAALIEGIAIVVKIEKPISIGHGQFSQVVLAVVDSGRNDLVGKHVIIRFFDPLYLDPDNLTFVSVVSTFPSCYSSA